MVCDYWQRVVVRLDGVTGDATLKNTSKIQMRPKHRVRRADALLTTVCFRRPLWMNAANTTVASWLHASNGDRLKNHEGTAALPVTSFEGGVSGKNG